MFDDTPDGNGNPVVTTPLFRQDLAAPFGSAGEQPGVEGFSNGVYTVAFDPTSSPRPRDGNSSPSSEERPERNFRTITP
jgi:hypothetical protein